MKAPSTTPSKGFEKLQPTEPSLHATALGAPWEAPHSGGPGEPPNRAGHSPLEKSPPGPMGPLQQT